MVVSLVLDRMQQPLNIAAQKFGKIIDKYPTIHKIIQFASHFFRGLSMGALMLVLPFNPLTSHLICASSTLLYRLAIERHCMFKFALPAYFGGSALYLLFSRQVQMSLIGRLLTPLWLLDIAYLSHKDVEDYMKKIRSKFSCCNN